MNLIYRAIANATVFVTVVLFIMLTLIVMVAPEATAAVINNLFRLELESWFWNGGGVIFLGGAILWVGGIFLAVAGGALRFDPFARDLAHSPGVKATLSGPSANAQRREEPKPILEPRPPLAGPPAGPFAIPRRDDEHPETPLKLQEVCDETEHTGIHRHDGHGHGRVVHPVRTFDRFGAGSGLRRI